MKHTMNQVQYAKYRGVSQQCISYHKARGVLADAINEKGRIDPELADSLLDERLLYSKGKTPPHAPEPRGGKGKANKKTLLYWKTRKEACIVKLKRLEYLEKTGKLVNVEGVKKEAFEAGRYMRDLLITEFENQAAEIAGAASPAEVEKKLKGIIDFVFSQASGGRYGAES